MFSICSNKFQFLREEWQQQRNLENPSMEILKELCTVAYPRKKFYVQWQSLCVIAEDLTTIDISLAAILALLKNDMKKYQNHFSIETMEHTTNQTSLFLEHEISKSVGKSIQIAINKKTLIPHQRVNRRNLFLQPSGRDECSNYQLQF